MDQNKARSVLGRGIVSAVMLGMLCAPVFAEESPCRPPQDAMATVTPRFGVAQAHTLPSLLDQPRALQNRVYEERIAGTDRLAAVVDYHAVYPVEAQSLETVLMMLGEQEDVVRNVSESEVLCFAEDAAPHYYRQRLVTEFGFLFFKARYDNVLHVFVEPTENPGTFRQRFTLAESSDGKMIRARGSWYLEPVTVNGTTATYVRYYYESAFAERSRGLRFALERFSERQVEKTLTSIFEAAVRPRED